MRQIEKLWKLLEINPHLLASTHTVYVGWDVDLYESSLCPFDAMMRGFTSRLHCVDEKVKEMLAEAEGYGDEPDEEQEDYDEDDHKAAILWRFQVEQLKEKYATDGPDGTGLDENILGPTELETAMSKIFTSCSRIRHLHWPFSSLPFFSSCVDILRQTGSLESLELRVDAADEDHRAESAFSSPPRKS